MTAHPPQHDLNAAPKPRVAWITSRDPVPYGEAIAAMEARASAIFDGFACECVWLLAHPCVYTGGTSAKPADLVHPSRFPVIPAGRGGGYTYHGPGQRVAYVMLDLARRGRDVRAFVRALEDWLIATLALLGVEAERRPGAVGIFVDGAKIASIGVRVRRWITFHGVSSKRGSRARAFLRHRSMRAEGHAGDEPRGAWRRMRHGRSRPRAARYFHVAQVTSAQRQRSVARTVKPVGGAPPSSVTITAVTRASCGPSSQR